MAEPDIDHVGALTENILTLFDSVGLLYLNKSFSLADPRNVFLDQLNLS